MREARVGGVSQVERGADPDLDRVAPGKSTLAFQQSETAPARWPDTGQANPMWEAIAPTEQSAPAETAAAATDEETLPESVADFAVAPDGWSALVRTKWVMADQKPRLLQILKQMQRLGAFGWAKEEGLRRAAEKTLPLDGKREVVRYMITLRTLAQMGLPELSGAMVAREGDDLVIALKIPGVKDDDMKESHALALDDRMQVYRAVEKFTNLSVKTRPAFEGLVIRDGIMEVQIPDKQAAEMFGAKAWADWKKQRSEAKGGAAADKPADVSSELSFSERMRVESWLKENLELVDSGPVTHIDRSTLNVIDEIEKNPDLKPILKELVEKKTKAPGQVVGTFALADLLEAAKTERDRRRLGTDKLDQGDTKPLDPSEKVWNIDAKIVQKGLVFADREMPFQLELDWDTWKMFRSADDIDKFSKRETHVELEWAVERLDKPDKPATTKQTHDRTDAMVLKHTFKLPADDKVGRFKVHAFMRSAHFFPKHVTTEIEVKTEATRMEELRDQELGDMMGPGTWMMNYEFDIGTGQKVLSPVAGSSRDTHGYAISGALPKDFKHRDPAERKKARDAELELQQKLAAYLRKQTQDGKPGYGDALKAAEQRIKFLEETEQKLENDTASGWKPFEVRGTYLSRTADVPSGGLELYGFVKTSMRLGEAPKFEIKLRDLSNKIESDLEFTGEGEHFDDALREAFIKLAKAYPDGKVAVLAEDLVIDAALRPKPNGRSIGYELATTSAWKRVKSKVYDPVVQILTNAAAMAIMLIFPGSAAVIVPMLAVADIVNNVDDMVSKHDKGKLTLKNASIDLLQIGLDVLPAARSAKVLNPAKSAVAEAKGMANMRLVMFDAVQLGGQFIVMYERTKEQLVEIQDKQISVMADKYRALIELEKQVAEGKLNPSDPQLAQRRAEIEADAAAIRNTVTTTWTQAVQHQATFFVGSHLVGGHDAAAAGQKSHDDTHFAPKAPKAINEMEQVSGNTFKTKPTDIRSIRDHYEHELHDTTHIEYDPKTGTAHFTMTDHAGVKTRVETQLGHVATFAALKGATNKVVGQPLAKGKGVELLGKLNRGDASALAAVGITDTAGGKLPAKTEFGIGRLRDGTEVLVIGEPAAVDWAHLPGLEPIAHTHPPDATHDFKDQGYGGPNRVAVTDLLTKKEVYIPREAIYPSGADVIVMAHGGHKGHAVVTEFIVRDGIVMKAEPGDPDPRLIFTIAHAEHAGSMPDGRSVYTARIHGETAPGQRPIDQDVWVVADKTDSNGHLFIEKPADAVMHAPNKPPKATRTETTPLDRTGPIRGDEQVHFDEGHFTSGNTLEGGGHGHGNMAVLKKRGYEELSGDEVRRLRAAQAPYEAARIEFQQKALAHTQWLKKRDAYIATLEDGRDIGKLKNPKLDAGEKTRIEAIKARRDTAIAAWEAANPSPGKPRKPKPEDFGINPAELLTERHYYYHERLGTSGAEIGGVSSRNPIHEDGHTWFPPGWEAAPIMAVLETSVPGVSVKPMTNDAGVITANKRTAWLRRNSSGGYDVAPASVTNPAADGYLKSSMIVPTDGAQRTVFPEMKQ